MSEQIKRELDKFYAIQQSFDNFGANDSEPNWYLNFLLTMAIEGKPLPKIIAQNWQLYESTPGWELAADKLTSEATRIYEMIQSCPVIELNKLKTYLG